MKERLRKSGIDIIGAVPWGTHFCQFYQTREDLTDILVPYFKAGLEDNELCVWVTSQPLEVEKAKEALRRFVPDIDVYLDKGQIEIIPYTHVYFKEGVFNPDRAVNSWVEKINQALAKGYDGLRASGDNRWLEKEGWNVFVDYENKVDAIIDKHNVIALCPYYLDKCSTAEVIDVVSNHQFALIKREGKWERVENFGRKRAEKEAIQAAKNWKHTFDAVPDPIAIIDDNYRIVRVNRAMAERLGLTPEECTGLTCYHVIHGTDNPPSFCPHRQLLKNGAEHTTEVCEDRLGGYFVVSTSPLCDSEGKLIGSIYVAHDINERKREEHKIHRYNRVLKGINKIFSSVVQAKTEEEVGNACLSVALEVTGSKFGFINEMGADGMLHDVAKSELAWEQCLMYDKTGHRRPPSDFAVHGLYGSVINNEKGFFTNDPPSHPDSIGLPCGHPPITSFLGVPLVQGGKTIGLIAVANRENGYSSEQQQNLEAIAPAVVQVLQRKKAEQKRKQAEEALQASEERYRSLYENSLDGIFLTKPDGTILCANPQACQMFGMTEDEIIRAGREGTVINDEKLEAALEERRLTGRMRAELIHKRKDGSTFVCDTTSKLFMGADGNLNTSLIIRDISDRKQAEEALRASEENFRRIVETANEGIWLIDSNEKTVFVNRKMSEMLGYSLEEILGQSPRKFMSPEFYEQFDNRLREHMQGVNQVVDYRLIRKDGSELWCILSSSPLFEGHGKYTGSLAMITDITERKRAEKVLQESELRLKLAQVSAGAGIWDWDMSTGKLEWSEELFQLFGLDPRKTDASFDSWRSALHPDDRLIAENRIETAINNRTPLASEYRIVLPSGEVHWINALGSTTYDSGGKPQRMSGICIDITERKRAEEALRESEEKYRIVADNTFDWEFWLDPDDRFLYSSPSCERVTGYAAWEFIDNSDLLQEIILPEDRQAFLQHRHKVSPGFHGDIEFRIITKDGEKRWIHHICQPLYDGEGRYAGRRGSNRDITERKLAEEEVQSARNMLQLIINNIPQGIFWKDLNFRYMGCNKVFVKAAGLESPESIVGKTDYELPWLPEQIRWFRGYDRKVMENDTPEYHIVEPQQEAEGRLAWTETNKIPLHDTRGNVIGILGTYEDITERKKAEEALRLSNLYNRSLIESSLDPLVTIGPDGKITDVNAATEIATGYSRDELIGTDFSDYFTEPEKAKKGYQQVFKEGSVFNYELEIQNRNGSMTPVLYNASVYKEESGKVIGVFAAARDITESKKAEKALKEAYDSLEEKVKERTAELEEAYKSLKESEKGLAEAQRMAHIGNWDWDLLTGRMRWSNELYHIFGRSPQKSAPLINEFLDYIHLDDRDYVDKSIERGLKKESKCGIDYRIILANGEERTVHSQAEVIFNQKNIPVRVKGIVQDITERKKTEEKIQVLVNAVESSNDAIITFSLEGIVLSWNKGAEHIYGYSAEEIVGKNLSITEPDNLKGEIKYFSEKIKQGEESQFYETLRLRKDGTTINISATLSPVFNASRELVAVLAIARDITERIKTEEAMAEIDKIRIKEIHHRIKNNLQVISSLLDLQAERFRNKEVLEAFRESQNRVTSMSLIHEELYKGGENNTLNFSTYLNKLAENLFQTYSLKSKNVRLCMDLEDNTLFDMDIAVPLGIIVNELVSNSLKHAFTDEGKGEIQIKLCREEKGNEAHKPLFSLTISDNGKGIPESIKLESLESLGLQLVNILVDQLGGKIEIKRIHGTEFRITFNVAERS